MASRSWRRRCPLVQIKPGIPLSEARFGAALPRPASLRDFYAFEQHVSAASANRGRPVPPEWYQFPIFYYTNHHSIFGTGDTIPYPSYTQALDYELEIACVIGKAGMNIPAEQADEHIFGYTQRLVGDIQRQEMKGGLGRQGKDLHSLGPRIVTR
jgi:fumarylacetoacetate (FAA) hydrolase